MNTRILAALALGCALTGTALADTVVIGDKVQVRESQMPTPKRGTTMSDVEKHFGAPAEKHPTVGPAADHPLGLQRLRRGVRARSRDRFGGHRRLAPPARHLPPRLPAAAAPASADPPAQRAGAAGMLRRTSPAAACRHLMQVW